MIFDTATSSFKSLPNFTNRFEDEAENNKPSTPFGERVFTVKADGDGIFLDAQSDTPTAGKVIERKIYHKAGFLESGDAIGDFTLIHTFADDTAYSATTSTFEGFRDGDTYGSPPFTLIQTWEEVDAFTGLLDTYSGAAAAYSLRQLRRGYTGDAVRVRRSSDNAEADIGFSNNELDTTALAAHCGSNYGFVKTWYDQSGNANDATQSTTANQPKIYDGTTGVVTDNGKPAVDFDGTDDALSAGSVDVATMTISVVHTMDSTSDQKRPFVVKGAVNGAKDSFAQAGDFTLRYDGAFSPKTQTPSTGTQYLRFSLRSTSAQTDHVNGTSNVNDTKTLPNIEGTYSIGNAIALTVTFDGRIQEAIAWESDQSSNRTGIESNINTFYSIF